MKIPKDPKCHGCGQRVAMSPHGLQGWCGFCRRCERFNDVANRRHEYGEVTVYRVTHDHTKESGRAPGERLAAVARSMSEVLAMYPDATAVEEIGWINRELNPFKFYEPPVSDGCDE